MVADGRRRSHMLCCVAESLVQDILHQRLSHVVSQVLTVGPLGLRVACAFCELSCPAVARRSRRPAPSPFTRCNPVVARSATPPLHWTLPVEFDSGSTSLPRTLVQASIPIGTVLAPPPHHQHNTTPSPSHTHTHTPVIHARSEKSCSTKVM